MFAVIAVVGIVCVIYYFKKREGYKQVQNRQMKLKEVVANVQVEGELGDAPEAKK